MTEDESLLSKQEALYSLTDEVEALKQQRDAQEQLIQNLRIQVELGEQRASAMMEIIDEMH